MESVFICCRSVSELCWAMNREGVVQRRTARVAVNQDDTPSSKNSETEDRHDSADELNDLDSKETRLTLMEEVLLLGLKDKEVFIKLSLKPIGHYKNFDWFLGIHFILEWLYIQRSTGLYSDWIGIEGSCRIRKRKHEEAFIIREKNYFEKWFPHRGCTVRRSAQTH